MEKETPQNLPQKNKLQEYQLIIFVFVYVRKWSWRILNDILLLIALSWFCFMDWRVNSNLCFTVGVNGPLVFTWKPNQNLQCISDGKRFETWKYILLCLVLYLNRWHRFHNNPEAMTAVTASFFPEFHLKGFVLQMNDEDRRYPKISEDMIEFQNSIQDWDYPTGTGSRKVLEITPTPM